MKRFLLSFCLGLCVTAGPLPATTPDCESLATRASREYGVPEGLLIAIARTESGITRQGQTVRAWPWTANIAGKSRYYDTRQEMLADLDRVRAADMSNFDVGCMQLNYRWHGDRFDGLERMLDPETNVTYAARYLRRLFDETGSWEGATRYYHSRDPDRGAAYLARVSRMQAALGGPVSEQLRQDVVLQVAATPASPASDERFRKLRPQVDQLELRSYWERAKLAEGTLPKLPGRP